ncbi:DUF1345 domain-containing protein [Pseudonocardia sp. ICBG1122]|nr:DUF1345 domain-containing protein [Pseudonocardia pini]
MTIDVHEPSDRTGARRENRELGTTPPIPPRRALATWGVRVLDGILTVVTLVIGVTFLRGIDLAGLAALNGPDDEGLDVRGITIFLTLPVWLLLAAAFIVVRLRRMRRARLGRGDWRGYLAGSWQGYVTIAGAVLAVTNGAQFALLAGSDDVARAAEAGGYDDFLAVLEVYAIATVILSWGMLQLAYAERYARLWLAGRARGRDVIGFPDTPDPTLAEFVYFALTFGVTFATSDVEIRSSRLRSVAVFHSVLAFLINTVIVASMVGLLGR